MSEQRNILLVILIIVVTIAALAGLTWANYRFAEANPGGNDFLARWMGAQYWVMKGISPYDEQVSLASQEMIYGRPADKTKGEDIAHFVYPLNSMIFFAPFGLLDFTQARALWMTLLEISLVGLALVSIRLADWQVSPVKAVILILFTLFWYHGVRTIVVGQFAGINALLIGLALYLIMRQQDFMAGILLALSTAKPQMVFLLIPFIFLWAISTRRRDLIGGMLVGGAFLLAASLALMPDWPLQWLRQLMEYPSYTTRVGSPISVIANSMPGIARSLSTFLYAVTMAYLAIEWFFAWGKNQNWFLWTAFLTIVITNLVAYRTATTNYLMMVPALFVVFKTWEDRWQAGGKIGVWLSLLLLAGGLWWLFLATVQGNEEAAIMYLPLPFFTLIGLWWIRWWLVRPPRVLLEDLASRID